MQTPAMAPCRSFLEAGVRQPIIHQVADAVHRVFEEGGGGEHEHPDRWIDEGDDVKGGNESGEFRDSFISYRIAIVQSADQVALEAGNSASIIFKHYRELTTPEVAEKWFSILPKQGQWENTLSYDRKKRRVILNGVECQ